MTEPGQGSTNSDDAGGARNWLPILLPALVVALLALGSVAVTLPYYSISPGMVLPVGGLIDVPDDRAFPPSSGTLSLTTVNLHSVTPLEALLGWLDRDVDVLPSQEVLGTSPSQESEDEHLERDAQSMERSKDVAVIAALGHLDLLGAERGRGALVVAVKDGSPADGMVVPGEVITAVGLTATPLAGDLVGTLGEHSPGESVVLEVLGLDGERRADEVVLAPHPEASSGFLGVSVRTADQTYEFPFDVGIDKIDAGGSSAGLALALGVVDLLAPGELTGGHRVVATGTINPDGSVGEVGGTGQKAAAARASGADYFLVPPGGLDAAVAHAGDTVEVLTVSSLDEALAVLEGLP